MGVAGATSPGTSSFRGRMMRSGRSRCITSVVVLLMYAILSVTHNHYIMGRRRGYARFWTSKRRKTAAFKAGEWRRWLQYQEEYEQRACSLNVMKSNVAFVAYWPSSVQWPYGRQPVATCQTKTEALLEL